MPSIESIQAQFASTEADDVQGAEVHAAALKLLAARGQRADDPDAYTVACEAVGRLKSALEEEEEPEDGDAALTGRLVAAEATWNIAAGRVGTKATEGDLLTALLEAEKEVATYVDGEAA